MTEGTPHEYKERPGACAECGNSPVHHRSTHFTHSFAVWSSSRRDQQSSVRRWFEAQVSLLVPHIDRAVYSFFAILPITRFSREVEGAATYRSQVIWEEAMRRGISMEQMLLLGRPTEVYRAALGGKRVYFQSLPIPSHLDRAEHGWIDDKCVLKDVLRAGGVPVPRAQSVRTLSEAREALQALGGSVVVKPQAGSRGRHTTVNVANDADLARAFQSAKQLCHFVAIEEYLPGSVCRGTVVGGKLVGLLQAYPPRVVGDGASTIRELVTKANLERPDRVEAITMTDEHLRFLARSGYTLESTLPLGTVVALTHRTGRLFGGRTRELLGAEHPQLRTYLERAAATIGSSLVGFDFVTEDPCADPDAQRWGIIEANTLPYIDLHYLPLEGAPSNVAAAVWDLWKRDA